MAQNAESIAKNLMGMSSVIKLHLAAEDQALYPALAKSPSANVAKIGKQFQDEMGCIAKVYIAFAAEWLTAAKIASKPDEFKNSANLVFKALHERIQKEETVLYPAAEAV